MKNQDDSALGKEQDHQNVASRDGREEKSIRRSHKKLPWWFKWICIPLLVLGVFAAAWVSWLFKAHVALNAELNAIRSRGEPMSLMEFPQPNVAPDDNAARYLKEATEQYQADISPLVETLDSKIRMDGWENVYLPNDIANYPILQKDYAADLENIVSAGKGVLDNVRKAAQCTEADWELPQKESVYRIRLPDLGSIRSIVKYLNLLAALQHCQGRDDDALTSIENAFDVSESLDAMPFLITHMVRIAGDSLTCDTIERLAADISITPTDAGRRRRMEELISRLLDDTSFQKGLHQCVLAERFTMFSYLDEFVQCRMSAETAQCLDVPKYMRNKPVRFLLRPMLMQDEARCLRSLSAGVEASRQNDCPSAIAKLPLPPTTTSRLDSITHVFRDLCPSWHRGFCLHYVSLAKRRMAAVALACRLYRADHGKYPDKLSDLVPRYLPDAPVDPFDVSGSPLRYRPDKKTPIVYSVGTNGGDDGGFLSADPERYFGIGVDDPDLVFFLAGNRPCKPLKKVAPSSYPMGPGGMMPSYGRSRRHPVRIHGRRRIVMPTYVPTTQPK